MKTALSFLLVCLICSSAFAGGVPCDQLRQQGSVTNLKAMEALSEYIIDGRHGAYTTWNNKGVDAHMASSFVVNSYTDGDQINFVAVSPNKAGSTDFAYLRMWVVDSSPIEVQNKEFKDWKYVDTLGRTAVLENKTGTLNIYLVPLSSGTLVVKTESGNYK